MQGAHRKDGCHSLIWLGVLRISVPYACLRRFLPPILPLACWPAGLMQPLHDQNTEIASPLKVQAEHV